MNLLLLLGLPAWAHVDVSNNGYWTRRTPENFSVISLDDQQEQEQSEDGMVLV